MKTNPLFISVLTVLLCTTLITKVTSQVTHTLGANLPLGLRSYSSGSGKNTDAYYMAAFSYGFRHHFSETDRSSFSVGPLISIGGGLYDDGYGGGFLYSGDLQACADYNRGMGAVADPSKNTGIYFGLGFGVSYTRADGQPIDDDNGVSLGPMIRAGFRFGIGDTPLGVGVYYKHGLENAKWRTFGFHILADL